MSDLWQDEGFGSSGGGGEGFGGENDWDEGEESIETDVEDGFDTLGLDDDEASWPDDES